MMVLLTACSITQDPDSATSVNGPQPTATRIITTHSIAGFWSGEIGVLRHGSMPSPNQAALLILDNCGIGEWCGSYLNGQGCQSQAVLKERKKVGFRFVMVTEPGSGLCTSGGLNELVVIPLPDGTISVTLSNPFSEDISFSRFGILSQPDDP